MATAGVVRVPSRFEALRTAVGADRVAQVLIEPHDDLPAVKSAILQVQTSQQGKMLFVLGRTGCGKTSLAEGLRVFLPAVVGQVLTPPPDFELPIEQLPQWLAKTLPGTLATADGKLVVINLDGREVPATNQAVTDAAMVNLNAMLRRTSNVLALWPIVDSRFADEIVSRLQGLGGQSALAAPAIHSVVGLQKSRYTDVLRLILDTTSARLEDAAISQDEVDTRVESARTIGEFLESIQHLVVSRYDLGALSDPLPRLSIVITSGDDPTTQCRQLRRGSKYLLDADRLLQFSRANIAEDWRRRGATNARHGLPFIVSLLEAKLLSISASAVVNACGFAADEQVRQAVRVHYPSPVSSNAENSLRNSALARSLRDENDVGFAAASGPSAQITAAYKQVQSLTHTKHREINAAILTVAQRLEQLADVQFEYSPLAARGKDLRPDVWIQRHERPEALEFSHYSSASEATIATYVLGKLQDYARDYGLI